MIASSTSLLQSFKGSCSLQVFSHNLWEDYQRHTLAPLFNSHANAAPVSMQALPVQCHYSAGTDIGCGALETTYNRMFDMSHTGMNDPRIAGLCFVGKNRVSERQSTTIRNNPPCPITQPSRHHLFIIHLIKGLHCFYHITMSFKLPLVSPERALIVGYCCLCGR